MKIYFTLILVSIIFMTQLTSVSATSLSIKTDKSEYYFGDLLSFVINVSEVTGEPLTLHIRDEAGKSSTPIVLAITNSTTSITAREPFDPTIYKAGTFFLDVDYSGSKASTSFKIVSTDKIIIPTWVKNLGGWWAKDLVTDKDFARGIGYLIEEKIIIIPTLETGVRNETKIPDWMKTNAGWWAEDRISDNEFALTLQYLIKNGIIFIQYND